jgi:hypothetical protein
MAACRLADSAGGVVGFLPSRDIGGVAQRPLGAHHHQPVRRIGRKVFGVRLGLSHGIHARQNCRFFFEGGHLRLFRLQRADARTSARLARASPIQIREGRKRWPARPLKSDRPVQTLAGVQTQHERPRNPAQPPPFYPPGPATLLGRKGRPSAAKKSDPNTNPFPRSR